MKSPLSTNKIIKTRKEDKRFLDLFFEYVKNGSNIKSRKNRRKSRFLSYTYIGFKEWRYKLIPNILDLSVK